MATKAVIYNNGNTSADRAVVYARVSGDDRGKDGRNLAGQIDMGCEYANQRGYCTVAELSEDDRGASGAAFELPQLNKILEMARNHELDVLIVREIDRLSRNLAKQLIVEEELKRSGVRVEYVLGEYPDTPEGNFMKNVRASVAEYERLKIVERNKRGKLLKVKTGSVMMNGHPAYGYRRVNREGKWQLEIVEEDAAVVRLLFQWYAYGKPDSPPMTLHELRKQFMALEIPRATKGSNWARSSIEVILRNRTYTGDWVFRSDGQEYHVPVPAIIDLVTFAKVQIRMEENRSMVRQRARRTYLLSGMFKCGECGRSIGGRSAGRMNEKSGYLTRYYHCRGGHNYNVPPCSQRLLFRADVLEERVWRWVESFLRDKAQLARALAEYQEAHEQQNAPLRERLAMIDDMILKDKAQLEKVLDLYLSGDVDRDILTDRMGRLKKELEALEAERREYLKFLEEQQITEADMMTLQDFMFQVADDFQDMADDDIGRRKVLEVLKVSGVLNVENGQRVAYVRCELGLETVVNLSTSP